MFLLEANIRSIFIEGRLVLNDIYLCCEVGDRIWIRGVNGSGKTTLLKCLDGSFTYLGRIKKNAETFLIEPTGFFFDFLTLGENLALFGFDPYSINSAKCNDLFSTFSSGQKLFEQIKLLAQIKGSVLLVDDCFGYFDDQTLGCILDLLHEVGCSLIFTSQDVRVEGFQTKIFEIKDGTLVEVE
ncbi:MAG: hypothetical protein NZO16_00740 [Deltaproteobacteria bacterium]|nr:hypothetical protein [Deltaproteobacteria bacterium]